MENISMKDYREKECTVSIRENEKNKIVHFMFSDGEEDTRNYSRDDTDEYIINDLCEYYMYHVV